MKLQTSTEPEREPLSGLVERVTFHSPDTGFCVLRVLVRGHREPVTVIGSVAAIQPGEHIQASGQWDNHRDHGLQFKASFLKASMPTTLAGIEKYLGSGLIKGIGPVYAGKLVKAFGEGVFDLIETDPDRLAEITGIGPVRIRRISAGWAEQKAVREIMLFLQSHGISTSRAVRIYKTYGADAIPLVTENPYRLARDIRGIGFKSADQIAQKLGIEKTSMLRARAGITYALLEDVHNGHCALPEEELLPLAESLLEIPREPLVEALALEVAEGNVTAGTIGGRACAFLPHLWQAEQVIADRLRALASGAPPWPALAPGKAIPWVEEKLGVVLAASQRSAVEKALVSKAMVITGGPGVGKTTLVNAILKIVGAKGVTVALAAPTGRAAKRLSESTGLVAKTIHRLLEFDPAGGGFKRGPDQAAVERFGNTFRVGDKVMQIVNDYEKDTFNGDIGYVAAIDPDANEVAIDFDGRAVIYQFGELDEVMLAYAVSIHKSQGSEFPAVVIPVMTQHYAMLARNLLYTGVTRGRKLVVLVGQKKAVAIAVRGVKDQRRWSKLREWLTASNQR